MFGWGRRKPKSSDDDLIAAQPPGVIFPWPKGAVLTAIDELVLAIPMGLFDKDRPMGEFVFGPADMQMNIPPAGDMFFIRLLPGMSVSLARSVQSRVVADDATPRRIKVTRPSAEV
jgi:hypothetical protein